MSLTNVHSPQIIGLQSSIRYVSNLLTQKKTYPAIILVYCFCSLHYGGFSIIYVYF